MDETLLSLLPGNYWLTKSMDFSKTTKSGTLWYLKKWFVYYHYIFFKQTLHENDYLEIISTFNSFIESLDESVRDEAREFFYEVDIRSEFIRMITFCNTNEHTFNSEQDQKHFLIEAKKFYFMYIMRLGGQSGYKKEILDLINAGVVYSVIKTRMTQKMTEGGHDQSYIKGQFSDFHAVIRNERQIFFYYGFFNGSDKADLSGFYTMTRLGKSIIKATQSELIIIWEHQKLKMISQSPETKIDLGGHIYNENLVYSNFGINYHPYLTLLKSLAYRQKISRDEYQFVISRIKKSENTVAILSYIDSTQNYFEEIKEKIRSFNRNMDIKTEDFHKEIKKFSLGISGLTLDNDTNFFSFLSEDGLNVTDINKLNFVIKCYESFSKYIDLKNGDNFKIFEDSLRDYYVARINEQDYEYTKEVMYEWHKYIVSSDSVIMLATMYVFLCSKNKKYEFNLNKDEIKNSYKDFKTLLPLIGISKQDSFVEKVQEIQLSLSSNNLLSPAETDDYKVYEFPFDELVNETKLQEISTRISFDVNILRKRSNELIGAIKSFYFKNFRVQPSNLILCDACHEETFTTKGNYAYLEFHHVIPFSTDNGPDHHLNIVGICPTCHRKFHYATKEAKKGLYQSLSINNNPKITLEDRFDRLYQEGILEPLNIEFLRKENIISDTKYNTYMDQETVIS